MPPAVCKKKPRLIIIKLHKQVNLPAAPLALALKTALLYSVEPKIRKHCDLVTTIKNAVFVTHADIIKADFNILSNKDKHNSFCYRAR